MFGIVTAYEGRVYIGEIEFITCMWEQEITCILCGHDIDCSAPGNGVVTQCCLRFSIVSALIV